MRALRLAIALALLPGPAAAQVVTDGTLGAVRTIQGPQFVIPANLGRLAGANLFHSFRIFSIERNESANFESFRGIENIIARVTGGSRSEIFGRIRSIDTNANVYLINPAGVLFGTGASIDVIGAFNVSTADSMRFADGTVFSARVADGVTLSVAAPSAFVFRGSTAPITMTSATLTGRLGQSLAFVGGDIRIERSNAGGIVSSPSGAVALVATAGAGEIAIGPQFTPSGFASLGRVEVLAGTQISVAEPANAPIGSGRVLIRGGEIVIDRARIDATTRRGPGGSIDVAGGNVALHGANVIGVTVGAGNAPSITLAGTNIAIDGGSLVDTSCDPGCTTGNGGALTVNATGSFTMSGTTPTFLVSNSLGGGRTGHLEITAPTIDLAGDSRVQAIGTSSGGSGGIGITGGSVHLSGGAQVDASTRGSGAGGAVSVNADRVVIEGSRPNPDDPLRPLPSGFFSNTESSGNAGSISVRAGSLQVVRGGEISSSAQLRSSGQGGRISLDVAGELDIGGIDPNDPTPATPHLHGVVTNTFSTGAAGEISIRAGSIRVHDYGTIQSQSEGDGPAGHIGIEGGNMEVVDGSRVGSESLGRSDAGTIDVHLTGNLRIDGGTTHQFTGFLSSAGAIGGARGGSIRIDAGTITIANTGVVTSNAEETSIGGDISIIARRALVVGSRGGILSESTGSGNAGNITIRSDGTLLVQPNGVISTSARTSDGGDIAVSAAGLAIIDHGEIKTEVGVANEGRSNGGNVVLDLPTLVMFGGRVSANAYGGNGGNIHVTAPTLILSPSSAVTASSALGIDGTIQFDSPAVDLSGALTTPAPKYLDADTILSGRCTARLAGKSSALSVVVREEIPESPLTWFLARAADPEQCVAATGTVVR